MGKSIERKWLVTENFLKHNLEKFEKFSEYTTAQYYIIKGENKEVRVREYRKFHENKSLHPHYYLTVKKGNGLEIEETEIEINKAEFDKLACLAFDTCIVKDVVEFYNKNDNITIIYTNVDNGRLFYIDVEFDEKEEALNFDINKYIPEEYIIEEILNNTFYKNEDDIKASYNILMHLRGHPIYRNKDDLRKYYYADNDELIDINNPRECTRCGKTTDNGHDHCLRNLPGVKFACCGHGKAEGYISFNNDVTIQGHFKVFRYEGEVK